jgi:exonuclease VII large subunit
MAKTRSRLLTSLLLYLRLVAILNLLTNSLLRIWVITTSLLGISSSRHIGQYRYRRQENYGLLGTTTVILELRQSYYQKPKQDNQTQYKLRRFYSDDTRRALRRTRSFGNKKRTESRTNQYLSDEVNDIRYPPKSMKTKLRNTTRATSQLISQFKSLSLEYILRRGYCATQTTELWL